jgi:hypothetical protein
MLLVWLFATFASWANACLVQGSVAAANPPEHHQRVGVGVLPGGDHQAAAQSGEAHDPDPARQACAGFCEARQSIVAKAQLSKGETGIDAAVPPPASFDAWPAAVAWRTAPRWRPLAAPPPPGRQWPSHSFD